MTESAKVFQDFEFIPSWIPKANALKHLWDIAVIVASFCRLYVCAHACDYERACGKLIRGCRWSFQLGNSAKSADLICYCQ